MRKLASLQKVIDIQPIPDADSIEVITVLGWKVVVKKGTFSIGDLCIYFEIDSLLPELPMFEFLKASSWKEKLNAYKLKTIKLKGQVSQGLALPLGDFTDYVEDIFNLSEGTDLTEILKIEKYEPPVIDSSEGQSKSYNWEIPKTDETRVQSDPSLLENIQGLSYYISLKLDGTSATYILSSKDNELDFNVCSRNMCFKEYNEKQNEDRTIEKTLNENKYYNIARKYNIKENMLNYYEKNGKRLAIQGELIGETIQGNKMNIIGKDLYVFNVWETNENNELIKVDINKAQEIVESFNMKFVPILDMGDSFNYKTIDELLDLAKGHYCDYPEFSNAKKEQHQEGIVIRTCDSTQSFKVINNDFLLKNGE